MRGWAGLRMWHEHLFFVLRLCSLGRALCAECGLTYMMPAAPERRPCIPQGRFPERVHSALRVRRRVAVIVWASSACMGHSSERGLLSQAVRCAHKERRIDCGMNSHKYTYKCTHADRNTSVYHYMLCSGTHGHT